MKQGSNRKKRNKGVIENANKWSKDFSFSYKI